ncbi:GAK system ATP-grasp enzyme [Zhongshania marina]|uniref:ATP-grasp family protein n=1 Tax=Zhongshania marina TaxID=2304603 RepID=A0A2S4HB66_9GAMM|nr:GAK system ATP-grasp enzyme [Marortus luteolus]POP51198.1 ATP-grasp family protein [Marortus luteolus]
MSKLKIAVVGIPGKWSTEVFADALESRTGFRLVIDMAEVCLDLSLGLLMYRGINLCDLDGIVVKKISAEYSPDTLNRLEMLRFVEARGVRVFSSATSMLGLINRLSCTVTLRQHGIPMPDTVVTEDIDEAMAAAREFSAVVCKPLFSTKARGMCIINAQQEDVALAAELQEFQLANPVMYLQRKIELPGRDLGLVFLGGKYLGSYARVSQSDSWNTTINSGGRYALADPPAETIEIAQRAQAAFNLDFTTVDVAETDIGPVVFEVSAFGGFRGALEGAGIDAAALYSEYVLENIRP